MMADYWAMWAVMPWWYALLVWLALAVGMWMTARILLKAGHSPWWALLLFVPLLYIVGLWVFAFARWPRIDRVHVTPPSDYEGGWNIPERRSGEDDQRR